MFSFLFCFLFFFLLLNRGFRFLAGAGRICGPGLERLAYFFEYARMCFWLE